MENKDLYKEPHQRFKAIEVHLGLKQIEFANKLGFPQSYLSAISLGRKAVSNNLLRALIKVFHVSPLWMLTGQGPMLLNEGQANPPSEVPSEEFMDALPLNQTTHIPQTPNERLKAVRNCFNLNQKAFANAINYKQSYYSELEAGKREMTARALSTLIEQFNVSADWMLTGKGQMFLVEPVPARLALHEKCHPSPYTGFVRVVMPFIKS